MIALHERDEVLEEARYGLLTGVEGEEHEGGYVGGGWGWCDIYCGAFIFDDPGAGRGAVPYGHPLDGGQAGFGDGYAHNERGPNGGIRTAHEGTIRGDGWSHRQDWDRPESIEVLE
jgi:hypothetical protein